MTRKLYQNIAALLFVSVLLTACITTAPPAANSVVQPADNTAAEPISIKVGTLPYLSNSIMKIAQEEGYFAEQGLDVELIVQTSSNEFIPLLLQGELDVATPALAAGFFNAVANGGKIKAVLPLTSFAVQDCASIGVVARQSDIDAGRFATPAQWQGAKIIVSTIGAQSIPGYVLDQALRQSGLTLQDVALTGVDVPAQAAALTSGQADLSYAVEPWITRMTADPALAVLMPVEPVVPDLTASLIAYGAKLLDDPAIGERFAVAYLKAVRQYDQGKTPRNVELVAAYTQLEPALVEQICWSFAPPNGEINVDSLMDYQTWLQAQGLLDRLVTADEFLDMHFGEVANQLLGKVAP